MAVNSISYPIYPLSTRIEKGYITKAIPFFFVQYISDQKYYRLLVRTTYSHKSVVQSFSATSFPKPAVIFPTIHFDYPVLFSSEKKMGESRLKDEYQTAKNMPGCCWVFYYTSYSLGI